MSVSVDAAEEIIRRVSERVSALDGFRPGGALLGPRLMVAASGRQPDEGRLCEVGTAVELLRRATLVHRNPQEEAVGPAGRAVPLSHTLRGDMLFAESFRLLSEDGESRLGTILSRAMAAVSESELMSGAGQELEARIRRAAAYYRAAAATGAILGGIDPPVAEALEDWGQSVGEAHERALAGQPVPCSDGPPEVSRALCEWVLSAVGVADRLA